LNPQEGSFMRVLIIGAGIIGSVYGWALSWGAHEVVHLVRSGKADSLRDGLPFDMYDRRKSFQRKSRGTYRMQAVESLPSADKFDLVVVPVKHYALIQTLKQLVPQVGSADFLLLTQNWCGADEIDAVLPPARYVFADAKAGGSFSQGTLVAALYAIDIGSSVGEPSQLARKTADLFASTGILSRLHPEMLHYLWIQYAITGGLWAALIHAGRFDALLNHREAMAGAPKACRECLEVVSRRGVELSGYPEIRPFLTDSTLRKAVYAWVMRWMFRHDEYAKRCSAHAFKDPIEVKTFYDDLIAAGRRLGVSMPVMESYAKAIQRFAATLEKCS
jgi:2-dehydropantoate 2-reductase